MVPFILDCILFHDSESYIIIFNRDWIFSLTLGYCIPVFSSKWYIIRFLHTINDDIFHKGSIWLPGMCMNLLFFLSLNKWNMGWSFLVFATLIAKGRHSAGFSFAFLSLLSGYISVTFCLPFHSLFYLLSLTFSSLCLSKPLCVISVTTLNKIK